MNVRLTISRVAKPVISLCLMFTLTVSSISGQIQTEKYRDMTLEEAVVSTDMKGWSARKAERWYDRLPFLAGCNYIPRNAVNQIEMWQQETFSPEIIDEELGWAEQLGFNTLRVFLQSTVWKADPEGYMQRVDQFLEIADRHGMKTMLVIFSGAGGIDNKLGPQPEPIPGCHNRFFCGDPDLLPDGSEDLESYPLMERYVKQLMKKFGRDKRVLAWDLWNEPGWRNHKGTTSFDLMTKVVCWVRSMKPSQPLTIGVWNTDLVNLNHFIFAVSDIVSFHTYSEQHEVLTMLAERYKPVGRPIICTEYMARTFHCYFDTVLTLFKAERVGAISWGLVDGKMNTKWPWHWEGGAEEPQPWFHDVLHPDGTPYDAREAKFIRQLLRGK